jgi:hypothetical protein
MHLSLRHSRPPSHALAFCHRIRNQVDLPSGSLPRRSCAPQRSAFPPPPSPISQLISTLCFALRSVCRRLAWTRTPRSPAATRPSIRSDSSQLGRLARVRAYRFFSCHQTCTASCKQNYTRVSGSVEWRCAASVGELCVCVWVSFSTMCLRSPHRFTSGSV